MRFPLLISSWALLRTLAAAVDATQVSQQPMLTAPEKRNGG